MTKRSANQISLNLAVAIAVAVTLITNSSSVTRSSAQATINSNRTTQEEKPFDQAQKLAELTKQIAGKENLPAEQVFKNIQILKGIPAGRLLRIMELGYSRSLGVNCTHCHV